MKCILIIPVYNEGEKLAAFMKRVVEYFHPGDILVIDDGSTDGCVDNVSYLGIKTVRHSDNLGKGTAIKTGFKEGLKHGYEWIMTMDGDGQHEPSYIPQFLDFARRGEHSLIIGSRQCNFGGMPFSRRFSNYTTSLLLSILAGKRIMDAQCGYRIYRADFIRHLKLKTTGFDTETEILLEAFRLKAKIGWIPISTIYRDEISHINKFRDTLRFTRLICNHIFSLDR